MYLKGHGFSARHSSREYMYEQFQVTEVAPNITTVSLRVRKMKIVRWIASNLLVSSLQDDNSIKNVPRQNEHVYQCSNVEIENCTANSAYRLDLRGHNCVQCSWACVVAFFSTPSAWLEYSRRWRKIYNHFFSCVDL